MRSSTCADVEASAPEFALGLLSGPERAAVVDHIARCVECRRLVDGLAGTVDALLPAGPAVEPPPGFETRVLERLAPSGARRRGGAVWHWCAAAAVAVALLAAGLVAGRMTAPDDASPETTAVGVRIAPMVTSEGRRVGRAVVGTGPDTVFVAVPGWKRSGYPAGARYQLRVTLAGGRSTVLAPVHLTDGTWSGRLPVDGALVRGVAMVDGYGRQYCAARFPA